MGSNPIEALGHKIKTLWQSGSTTEIVPDKDKNRSRLKDLERRLSGLESTLKKKNHLSLNRCSLLLHR